MAKPKIPNQKSKYNALNKRLANYVALVRQIYDALNLEAAKMAESVKYKDEGKEFHFKNYPELSDRVKKLQDTFVNDISSVIYRGTSEEWKNSYQTNSDALKAFQERKDKGLNLSQKIWNQSVNYKTELEYAISSAIQKGTSAVTLSKRISKYLQDFKSLQKDYKAKYGKAVDCQDCEYRSIRLARSEINLAYRTAEQKRWEQMDFVVGQEVKLSNNHTCNGLPFVDICDDLKGKYPKDFKFTGWHPMCRCYVIPILKTEDEFWSESNSASVNEIKEVPKQFDDWVSDNIQRAKSWSTTPYFIRDNTKYVTKDFKVDVYNETEKSFVRKYRTNIAISRIGYLKSVYPNIPEIQLAAVNAYTQSVRDGNKNSTSREINRKLRNGTNDEYVDTTSKLISRCLKQLPICNEMTYRGLALSNKKLNDIYLSKLGDIIEEKGFMSASVHEDIAVRFISHDGIKKSQKKIILAIEGKNGRMIDKISEFNGIFTKDNQHEILFDKNTRFFVSEYEVKEGVYYIKLIEQ